MACMAIKIVVFVTLVWALPKDFLSMMKLLAGFVMVMKAPDLFHVDDKTFKTDLS